MNNPNELKPKRPFYLLAILFLGAFLTIMGAFVARGDIWEPQDISSGLPIILNTGPSYQQKAANLGAQDFYVKATGRWLSQGPKVVVVESILNTSNATAYCPAGYQLLSCSGARAREANDNCPEDQCGYVGVIAVDGSGDPATADAVGCKVGVDPTDDAEAVVHTFCIQRF